MSPCLLSGLVALSLFVGIFADFVKEHNHYRSYAGASNMKKLKLSTELQKIAQAHANRCIYTKNTNASSQSVTFQDVGENIQQSSVKKSDRLVVGEWTKGRLNYRISSNTCRAGASCEAYKQVFRAETEYVGCGTADCSFGFFTVCNYAPRGSPDAKPFTRGPSCCDCPKGYEACEENLCTS